MNYEPQQVFSSMQFCYPWRPYQRRVLDAVNEHLNDKRLHIVAAPGAGKTTLGLEVFRVLGKTSLVLSPTRIIRDQWIDRLKDFSYAEPSGLSWVSNDINSPALLTSITYQALHAKFDKAIKQSKQDSDTEVEADQFELDQGLAKNELSSFIKIIEKHKIKVLILDEAHHLRAEWWRALQEVCDHFPNIILVSLTATPPYDVEATQWDKYESLCGPIDEEISIPELVKMQTLCPHQDYIWLCGVNTKIKEKIQDHDDRVSSLCQNLIVDSEFEHIVLAHPLLNDMNINNGMLENDILKSPNVFIALLTFLKHKQLPINPMLLQYLDLSYNDIPELTRHWWEIVLNAMLFSKVYQENIEQQQYIDRLKKQLRVAELLQRNTLLLQRSSGLQRSLSLSNTKIQACIELHKLEYEGRASDLRQVILTDYIRDESIDAQFDFGELNLGAYTVFSALVVSSPIPTQLALLTGRICILNESIVNEVLKNQLLNTKSLSAEKIAEMPGYCKINGPLNQLTQLFTALLINGDVKVLIGTRSLLGEGWDAPVINSLILASAIGSFMLTNQMRGRAIRIDKNNPEKTSSIWHLAAIEVDSLYGWSDYASLVSRFSLFVGLSEHEDCIESGFERVATKPFKQNIPFDNKSCIKKSNDESVERYQSIHTLSDRWQAALTKESSGRVIPTVKTDHIPKIRSYLLQHSFAYLLIQITIIFLLSLTVIRPIPSSGAFIVLLIILLCSFLYGLPKTYAAIKIAFMHLPVDGALKQIGRALVEALCELKIINTPLENMMVNVDRQIDGSFNIGLLGSTFYESSLFSDCMAEILAPIDSPRYILARKGRFLFKNRYDYHAVPAKLAVKKSNAEVFHKAWRKHVSDTALIYTRSQEGRKQLLKAKMKAFSSVFSREIKKQERWQ